MKKLKASSQYKKDYKRFRNNSAKVEKLFAILEKLNIFFALNVAACLWHASKAMRRNVHIVRRLRRAKGTLLLFAGDVCSGMF